jgi:hypothetical protein
MRCMQKYIEALECFLPLVVMYGYMKVDWGTRSLQKKPTTIVIGFS